MIRPILARALLFFISVSACGGSTPPQASEPAATSPGTAGHDGGGGHHGGAGPHGAHADFPACAVLAKTCHSHDKDSDKAHACHVLGHSAPSNEECEAKRAECLAICAGADGGT